jgi:threonine/homoserine/homoserine lactone efflux protein
MPSVQTIALFMGTALALNLTPGPAILFIVSRCLGEGRAAAIVSVFGLATASIIHALAAAFGLSALLWYSPVAFGIIKYCGAAYLVYLGISGLMKGGVAGGQWVSFIVTYGRCRLTAGLLSPASMPYSFHEYEAPQASARPDPAREAHR